MTIAPLKAILLSLVDADSSDSQHISELINNLSPDDFYLDLGILDSFSINAFIIMIESEYQISFLMPKIFSHSISGLCLDCNLSSILRSPINELHYR